MKSNITKTLTLMAVIILSLPACNSILDEKPIDFVGPKQFYQNKNQCIAGINGAYISLNSIYNQNLIILSEGVSDLSFLVSSSVDAKLEISPASPGAGQSLWTKSYEGVMRCNAVVSGIQRSPLSDEDKAPLLAETYTLRAIYYYVLTSTFGDVPFYTDDASESFETLNRIAKLPRMSATATRDYLIDELNKSVEFMPHKRTSEIEGNRIGASVAYILIAKMAMWNKQFDIAKTALEQIQIMYGSLDQYSLTDTYFRHKNTPESIFEVQYTWTLVGLKKTSSVACFFTPSRKSGTDVYDGVSLPELGSKANPYTSITPSNKFVALYDENPDDPRASIIIARHYNGTWFSRPMSNNGLGKPWMGPKFWCPAMDNIADGNNQKVFRYADALLMLAECANELGNTTLALNSLNEVKKRATIPELPAYTDKRAFHQEIMNERARELYGEYGRKYDLVRWGIYYDEIKATIATESTHVAQNLRKCHEYYPIPDQEVVRTSGVLTNDAYNQN